MKKSILLFALLLAFTSCSDSIVYTAEEMENLSLAQANLDSVDWFDKETDATLELTPIGAYKTKNLSELLGPFSVFAYGKESPVWYYIDEEIDNTSEINTIEHNLRGVGSWFEMDLTQFDLDWDNEIIIFSAYRPISCVFTRYEENYYFGAIVEDGQPMTTTLNIAVSNAGYLEDTVFLYKVPRVEFYKMQEDYFYLLKPPIQLD